MAVSSAHWFHYEVAITIDEAGEPKGTIVNRQLESGALPGVAGSRPKVFILGDSLLVESNAYEAPPHPLWDWITAFIPFTHNAYVMRQQRAAQVRSFELQLPGLSRLIRAGCVLKLMEAFVSERNNPFSAHRHCEVALLEGGAEIYRWVAPEFSSASW